MLLSSVRAIVVLCALVMLAHDVGAVEVRQVTRIEPFVYGGSNITSYHTPVWSRDGQSLVAAADGVWDFTPPGGPPGYEAFSLLVAFDLDGNLEEPLFGARWLDRPSPDPTHTRFAFSCDAEFLCSSVGVFDLSAPDGVFPCLPGRNPAWSPDGLTIVTETAAGLQMFSPSGGAGVPLTTRGDDQTPAWSPDGNEIVFSSTQGGMRDLWIKSVLSGATRQLTGDTASDEWPAWSPDGRWIAFTSDRGGVRQIWAIPSAGGNPLRVVDQSGVAPAWSPDGWSLAFQSGSNIWIATGLRDVLVTVESRSWSSIKTLYRETR